MRHGRTIAFAVLALLAGSVVSTLPSAMGDSEDPFSALWDAIFDLQSRDDDLQAQIDELRAERDALLVQAGGEPEFTSDPYAEIEVEATEDGRTLIYITAGNNGPDRAAGVKLTAFYLMPLFEINSIDGDICEDKSRGIIECTIGTLEDDQETVIIVDATPRESNKETNWTVDISTTTADADYNNNHVVYDFETGSDERIEVPEVEQPVEAEPEETVQEPEIEEPEQTQDSPSSNSTDTAPQESSGNQTSTEEPEETLSNQTSTENESELSGNQTSGETEETAEDSGSNSTHTEGSEDASGETEQESVPEEQAGDNGAQEQPSESEAEPVEEQEPQEESAPEESEPAESQEQEESGEEQEPSGDESESGSEGGEETSSQ